MLGRIIKTTLFLIGLNAQAIIGGTDVSCTDDLSKSIVAIQMVEREPSGKLNFYKGSGVLVSDRVVLTAGHNFFYLPDPKLSTVIFDVQPTWETNFTGQLKVQVKRAEVLPGFYQTANGTENDLALILLDAPAPASYKPLAIEVDAQDAPRIGEQAIIAGYGRSSNDPNPPLSDFRLRKIALAFSEFSQSDLQNSQKLWFDQNNGGITGGDSGGPTLYLRSGKWRVYGVAIHKGFGSCIGKSCTPKSAFSNLSYYSSWIQKTLELFQRIP